MDGCMDACMHACMYGPVSRVPESVSLGDHTIGGGRELGGPYHGGGRDPESGLILHPNMDLYSPECYLLFPFLVFTLLISNAEGLFKAHAEILLVSLRAAHL